MSDRTKWKWFPALYESLTGHLVEIDGYEFTMEPAKDRPRCNARDHLRRLTCCLWPAHDGPHVAQPDISNVHDGPRIITSLRTRMAA
jgi:hypothetical protein